LTKLKRRNRKGGTGFYDGGGGEKQSPGKEGVKKVENYKKKKNRGLIKTERREGKKQKHINLKCFGRSTDALTAKKGELEGKGTNNKR